MFKNKDEVDLRCEMLNLKKQLCNLNNENNLLKVKVRKLQEEVSRKEKKINVLIDPRKSQYLSKIIYEQSARFLLDLQNANEKLRKSVREKDLIIKRLQNNLETAKLYSKNNNKQSTKNRKTKIKIDSELSNNESNNQMIISEQKIKLNKLQETSSFSSTSSSSSNSSSDSSNSNNNDRHKNSPKSTFPIKNDYLKYKGNPKKMESPESDLERTELFYESPHEEIQQLYQQFLELLLEVNNLKSTITKNKNYKIKSDCKSDLKKINTGKKATQKNSIINNKRDVTTQVESAEFGIRLRKKCEDFKKKENSFKFVEKDNVEEMLKNMSQSSDKSENNDYFYKDEEFEKESRHSEN